MSGTLVVKPIEAKLTHDTETLGKMDPYCRVLIGGQHVKGKVCEDGGKNPKWNDTIVAQRNGEPDFYLELLDDDTFKDDVIGVAKIDISFLQSQTVSAKWYPLFHKQKPAGEILLELTFTYSGNAGSNQSYTHNHAHFQY